VTHDKSTTYETLLKQLNLQSPLNQRIDNMASGVYKAIHGYKVPRGIGELLHGQSTNHNLRGKHIPKLPKVNTTTYGLKYWRYTAAKIWNALPDHFRTANNIGTFFFCRRKITRRSSVFFSIIKTNNRLQLEQTYINLIQF